MRARLLLPLLWLLSFLPAPRLLAQGRPLGPWHWTYQVVEQESWAINPAKRIFEWTPVPVRWNVTPDSIHLFLNCENPLIAPSQPHKGQLPIRFSATGATVRLDVKSHRLFIVPHAVAVTLWAYRGRVQVFKREFKAVPPPMPDIIARLSDEKHAIHERSVASTEARFKLNVVVSPDIGFAHIMPNDAKYRVWQYQLTILRNNQPLEPTRNFSGLQSIGRIPLDSAQEGDKINIDVQQVQRQNFRGTIEDVPFLKHLTNELL